MVKVNKNGLAETSPIITIITVNINGFKLNQKIQTLE